MSTIRKRQGNFEQVPRWIIERSDATSLRLWLILAKYADWQTKEAYPSRSRLARDMGVSLSTVDRSKARLVQIGALTWKRRGNDVNGYESNEYTLEWDDPLASPVTTPSVMSDATPSVTSDSLTQTQDYPDRERTPRCGLCSSRHPANKPCF